MADNTVTIEQLPPTVSLDGTELVPVAVPNGLGGYTTQRTSTGSIAAVGVDAEFVLVSSNPLLPEARILAGASGQVTINDGGAAENVTIGLAASGVAPGTYGDTTHVAQVTIDSTGRVTSAQNITVSAGGTVTSVALTAPPQFDVSGTPVTGAGTLGLTWANQSENQVFAGPASGGAGTPTFRALVGADLPTSGVTAGTYGDGAHVAQVAVDSTGRITSAAQVAITHVGDVTSVGLSLPSDFTISGSPVTSSGTLTGAWTTTPTGTGAMVRAVSPALTGTPTAPTASLGDNTTKIATTAFVLANGSGGATPVADRTALAALSTSKAIAWLEEGGRQGMFQWNSANLSTQVTADTQQGIYVAPSSDPTGASGAWVRQFNGPTNPAWFGFVPGSGTDAQLACATAVAALQAQKILAIEGGIYSGLLSEWNFSSLDGIVWLGPVFLDYSTASNAANFPDGALVYVGGSALSALPNLGANATIGDCSVTFASASGLSSGDRFCIFNPTNSSWSGFQSYYKAGEWCQVSDATSDPTIKIENPLYDSYTTTAVTLYKHPNKKFSITGPGSLTIIDSANSALNSIASFRADRIVDSDFSSIHGTNSSYSAMLLNQCINITGTGYWGRQWRNVGTGAMYGLNIANCQDINLDGVDFYGVMNGCTLGGFAGTGCVPNRNIRINGTLKSDATYGLYGAHMHGNSEYCYYSGTLFGVALAGDHTGCPGATIIDETGARSSSLGVVSIIEPLGFDFDCSSIHVKSQLNDTNGIFAAHGSTTGFNANTIRGGVINLDNSVWDCPHASRLLDIVNAGSTTTEKIVLSMNGLKWPQSDAATPSILISGLVSPATRTFDELHVAGVVNGPGAAWTLQLPCLVGGWSASGSASLTTTTSVTSASASVTWARPAPKTPKVMLGIDAAVGGSRCIPFRSSASVTGATIGAETPAGANFASSAGGVVDYHAVLDEC